MEHVEEKIKATPILQQHLTDRYQKTLIWIRTTITILTPSLALLIGLQEKPLPSEKLLCVLLLISILLMTLSILTGLWVLLGESKAHGKAVVEIKELVESGESIDDLPFSVDFPWHQDILLRLFPKLVWLSILFLGSFGFFKYL
jgi:hypothetical protein